MKFENYDNATMLVVRIETIDKDLAIIEKMRELMYEENRNDIMIMVKDEKLFTNDVDLLDEFLENTKKSILDIKEHCLNLLETL